MNKLMVIQYDATKKESQETKRARPVSHALNRGKCALINTGSIPENGKSLITIPNCSTITFYQAFKSPEAAIVWHENQDHNPLFAAMPPSGPDGYGLMVVRNVRGSVELMVPYPKSSKFNFTNDFHAVGSEYKMSRVDEKNQQENLYFKLPTPVITAKIGPRIYAGETTSSTHKTSLRL